MNKKLTLATIAVCGFLTLGMPGCPGQQALQQQLDQLQQRNTELTRRLQASEGQLKTLTGEFVQYKQLISEITNAVLAQKTAIEQLQASQSAAKKAPAKALPAKNKPKGKKH